MTDLIPDLVAGARAAFTFVEQRGATLELEEQPEKSILAYVADPATFEVELDWREECVFLLVCRTVDGHRPEGYYIHEGRRVRVHLVQALEELGMLDAAAAARLRAVTGDSGVAAMKSQLELLASTLQVTLDDLLSRFNIMFPPNATS